MILHVSNINFQTNAEELKLLFSQFGEVSQIDIPRDRRTKLPRGFAFIHFVNDEDALEAVKYLNNAEFGGRVLNVEISKKN